MIHASGKTVINRRACVKLSITNPHLVTETLLVLEAILVDPIWLSVEEDLINMFFGSVFGKVFFIPLCIVLPCHGNRLHVGVGGIIAVLVVVRGFCSWQGDNAVHWA